MLTKTANELVGKRTHIAKGHYAGEDGTIDQVILLGLGGAARVILDCPVSTALIDLNDLEIMTPDRVTKQHLREP